jgi:hypothetical protein
MYMYIENNLITNANNFGMVLYISDVFTMIATPNNKDYFWLSEGVYIMIITYFISAF